ncbi:MAG: cytochrome c3 family protein [Deltaproteobacteria bacterium]
MRKIAVMAAAVAAAVMFAGAVDGGEPQGKIVLKVYPKRTVSFDHKGHAKRIGNCRECHHMSKPGDEEKCSDCHSAKGDKDTPSFREAMHMKCKNCHAIDNRKVRGACKECHPEVKSKL